MAFPLAAFLPSLIGVVGSLFKGKKQKYTTQQTPQQASAYNQLLAMLQRKMGQPSAGMQAGQDALSLLYSTFLGKPYQAQAGQTGVASILPRSANTKPPTYLG